MGAIVRTSLKFRTLIVIAAAALLVVGGAQLGNMKTQGIIREVDKGKILKILHDRGLHARAEWVDRQLPQRVDLEKNAGLLATLHISPAELADP